MVEKLSGVSIKDIQLYLVEQGITHTVSPVTGDNRFGLEKIIEVDKCYESVIRGKFILPIAPRKFPKPRAWNLAYEASYPLQMLTEESRGDASYHIRRGEVIETTYILFSP